MDLATDLLLLMTLEILEVNIVMRRVITDIVIPLSGCMQYIAGMVCGSDVIHSILLGRKVFVLSKVVQACLRRDLDMPAYLTHFPVLTSYVVK